MPASPPSSSAASTRPGAPTSVWRGLQPLVHRALPESLRAEVTVVTREGPVTEALTEVPLQDVLTILVGSAAARGETSTVLVDTHDGAVRVHDDGIMRPDGAVEMTGIHRILRRVGVRARTLPSDQLCGSMTVVTPLDAQVRPVVLRLV